MTLKNLCFSGGGIKGLSYIGVIQALEEYNTSMEWYNISMEKWNIDMMSFLLIIYSLVVVKIFFILWVILALNSFDTILHSLYL